LVSHYLSDIARKNYNYIFVFVNVMPETTIGSFFSGHGLHCDTALSINNKRLDNIYSYIYVYMYTEADLGMFSMFGRIETPTKRGPPQKDKKIVRYAYKYYSNTPSLANSLLQKGWPQTASQLLLQ